MKKLLFFSLSTVLLSACTKDLTEKNNDPKNPLIVPSYTLVSNSQKLLVDALTTSDVNTNIFRMLAQQTTETTYTDESNYDLITRDIPRQWWNVFYRDVIKNLDEAKKLIPTDVLDPGQQANEIAISDMLIVLSYYYLVTTYGNIPYTEATNIDITQPTYDDASTVYTALLSRLDADINALNPASPAFGAADLIYKGDVALWKKFGYSLKLRMGILLSDSDPATAKATVEAAAPNVFTSNADNAAFEYLSAPPNTNPAWADQINSARQDFVATSVFVDPMNALNDPRRPFYFSVDANGAYSGGEYGSSNNFASFSKPRGYPEADNPAPPGVFQVDFTSVILSYSEVEFYLAEAAARGFSVGGTIESHYNAAITASIEEWGGTAEQAAAYIAQPGVNYATAPGDWKQKIGTQAWIAFFNKGFEAWTEWRRLDVPALVAPPENVTNGIPVRYSYSVDEQNLNQTNYTNALTAMGMPIDPQSQKPIDEVTFKLWFDKY